MDLLREADFAQSVGPDTLARLVNGSVVHLLPAGAVLFEEGALPDAAHVVLSGRVGLVASDGGRNETVIEIFGAVTFLLIPAVLLGLPYLASGIVLAEARVMTVRADVFRAELDADPRFVRAMADMLARHWRQLVEQIRNLKLRGATERLADWLEREVEANGDASVVLSEPKGVLARRLGMSPESLSRAIATLSERGAIRPARRSLVVLDRERLREAASLG